MFLPVPHVLAAPRADIPYSCSNGFHGTPRYASIHTHEGIAPSRRDDLESLAYVLIYLFRGHLPWQSPPAHNKKESKKEKRKRITDLKKCIPLAELCKGMPQEFATFLDQVRRLEFREMPAYDRYRAMFEACLDRLGEVSRTEWFSSMKPKPPGTDDPNLNVWKTFVTQFDAKDEAAMRKMAEDKKAKRKKPAPLPPSPPPAPPPSKRKASAAPGPTRTVLQLPEVISDDAPATKRKKTSSSPAAPAAKLSAVATPPVPPPDPAAPAMPPGPATRARRQSALKAQANAKNESPRGSTTAPAAPIRANGKAPVVIVIDDSQ